MNIPNINEVNFKIRKVRTYLEENGYQALIIGRQDNFAWITDGGNNRVIIPSDSGFSLVVITQTQQYLVSQVMDGPRVMEEEVMGLDFEYIPLHWYECSREEKAMSLTGGGKVISDLPIPGADYRLSEIYKLQYPLTEREISKLRWLGATTEKILSGVAAEVKPGMTEHEIEAMLLYEYGKENIYTDVLLVGSDERIYKYRHPNPSDKKVDKYVLLHPAVRKWGLHANVTRLMYFGDNVPDDIKTKFDAVSTIEAAAISMCETGNRFSDILAEQKKLYKELGFEDEWRNHYQGGITGYFVGDGSLCNNPSNLISSSQAFDWFITITGSKVEELSLNTQGKQEIVSVTGLWPVKKYSYNNKTFELPDILIR